jgi:Lar family restriction alleviation protein
MSNKYGLLPCPFCGGEARLEENSRGFIGGESTKICYVWCKKCNARSGRVKLTDYGRTSHSAEAINDVVSLWNRRSEAQTEA